MYKDYINFVNFADQNFSLVMVLSLFLILGKSQPGCSYKVCSYKKSVYINRQTGIYCIRKSSNRDRVHSSSTIIKRICHLHAVGFTYRHMVKKSRFLMQIYVLY